VVLALECLQSKRFIILKDQPCFGDQQVDAQEELLC
jgi:hypothetical protein